MAHKLIILLTVLSTVLFLAPLSCSGKKPQGSRTGPVAFGDIQLSAGKPSGDGSYLLEFSRKGEIVFRGECAFKIHDSSIVKGVPYAHCRSLISYCFSGGAHCCLTAIVATDCDSSTCLNTIDLGHSDQELILIDENSETGKKIKVTDWQFAYYSLEDSDFLLSFADSPGLTRLLLFDKGRWRVDQVGEFSQFYSRLLQESLDAFRKAARRRADQEEISAIAIRAAYYAVMSGAAPEEAAEILRKLLPAQWVSVAPRIIADIRRAVTEFNPVEKIL